MVSQVRTVGPSLRFPTFLVWGGFTEDTIDNMLITGLPEVELDIPMLLLFLTPRHDSIQYCPYS